MSNSRKKYDEEFKRRAVRMSYSSERPVKAVAESLGITSNIDLPLAQEIHAGRRKNTAGVATGRAQ